MALAHSFGARLMWSRVQTKHWNVDVGHVLFSVSFALPLSSLSSSSLDQLASTRSTAPHPLFREKGRGGVGTGEHVS